MFICEIWLFDWYFPQFCTSDMSKYGYLEVFQRFLRLRDNESRLYLFNLQACMKFRNVRWSRKRKFQIVLIVRGIYKLKSSL